MTEQKEDLTNKKLEVVTKINDTFYHDYMVFDLSDGFTSDQKDLILMFVNEYYPQDENDVVSIQAGGYFNGRFLIQIIKGEYCIGALFDSWIEQPKRPPS